MQQQSKTVELGHVEPRGPDGLLSHQWFLAERRGAWWVGEPDQGFGEKQYGGWFYNVLPFIEQQAVHDVGAGNDAQRKILWTTQVGKPVAAANCPSRRPPATYGLGPYNTTNNWQNINMPTGLAKLDYAVNAGSTQVQWSLDVAAFGQHTGISYGHSTVRIADINDGTSNTYAVGEKRVPPDAYIPPDGIFTCWGDNASAYSAHDWSTTRYTYYDSTTPANSYAPSQDQGGYIGVTTEAAFGGAHSFSFNMAFCDGSVRSISYNISLQVHSYLGNRNDGAPIDASTY